MKASGIVADDVNLKVPDDEGFLLRFLRARKFDSQKAFAMVREITRECLDLKRENQLQRYYLMKLKCPELFGCPLPSENGKVFELQAQNMLQQRDQLGRRVYIIRVGAKTSLHTLTTMTEKQFQTILIPQEFQ